MNKLIKLLTTLLIVLFSISACDDDDDMPNVNEPGSLSIMMENKFGTDNVNLSSTFTSSKGDDLTFTRFEYIISNIALVMEDGSNYEVPDSYFIMGQRNDNASNRQMFELSNIPAGTYTGIKFAVGVDAASNANTDNYEKGELEGGIGMDWGWASGYKFIRWDGSYFNNAENTDINFSLHIGTDDNYKVIEKDFTENITINAEMTSELHFEVRANKVFDVIGFNELGLNFPPSEPVKTFSAVMFGPADKASTIADAYADMFMLHHVNNMN
ncbi:MAG: MbnP family protein [Bacteroidota bacterium]